MNNSGGVIGLIILAILGWWVYSSFIKSEWLGIYESGTSNQIYTQKFSSKEECADWLADKQVYPGSYTNYECGMNCEPPKTTYGLYICKETF
jgi:hypothetical protein